MIGQQFGHYDVVGRLGSGGMGVVYLARDTRLDRRVAIKVLPDGRVTDERARTRFRREAQALSRLNHPNIATIFDFDQCDGRDFLVMEYIEGQSLRDVGLDPLPPAEVVRLGTQLAEALAAAHSAGVVHLDLKPGNLMRTPDGRLKVLDFGIARLQAIDSADGTTHTVEDGDTGTTANAAGSPPYMAPEQVAAGPVDGRTDIYAAGATLYELATGRRLFTEPRGVALYESILRAKPDAPSGLNGAIDPELEGTLLKALEKSPFKRQQDAKELLADLQRCATTSGTGPARPQRWRRRPIALTAAASLVAIATTGYALWPTPAGAKFHAREFVLVGDLENRTNDPLLSRTVQEALTIALQQSQFVNLVSRARVVDALRRKRHAPGAPVDEAAALDICQRDGIPALITGGVNRSGETTQITIKVLEAGGGSLLFAETAEYTKAEDLFGTVDDLARRVRRNLGESLSRIATTSQPVQKVTTVSIEALRQYSGAVEALARGDYNAVAAPLLAALQLDPEFAMAHLKLANYYVNIAGDKGKGVPEMAAAYRLRDRVTDRERHLIAAQYFQAHDQFEQSRDSFKILTSLYPDDPEAAYELALVHYALEELKPGIAALRTAIRLNPHAARAHGSLALFLARDNQPQAAIDATNTALSAGVDSPYLYWARGLALLALDRLDEARADFERMARTPGYYTRLGLLHLARASLYSGDVRDGATRLSEVAAQARRAEEPAFEIVARVQLARAAAMLGDRSALGEQSAAIAALLDSGRATPNTLLDSGAVALLAGDLTLAKRQLARLVRLESSTPTAVVKAARLLLDGEIALTQRQAADAARLQDEALSLVPWFIYSRARAAARELLGDENGAAAAWQAILHAKGQILQDGFPPDLAVARERLARPARQRKDARTRKDE